MVTRPPPRAFIALLALLAAACAPAPAPGPDPALWKVSDADSEIYLFGTVHVLPPDLDWRSEKVNSAFAAADQIVFETATGPEAEADIAALVVQYGRLPEGETLTGALNAEEQARLARVCRGLRLDPALFAQARPWLAALQISAAFAASQGLRPQAGVERVLEGEAARAGKSVRYLETAEQQVRFLADLKPEVQRGFLAATLRQIEEEEDALGLLERAWAAGDLDTLGPELNRAVAEAGPDVYEALIRDRNARWTLEIEQMLKGEGVAFVAVGAAHLIGRDSVAEMLRARGHQVEGQRGN